MLPNFLKDLPLELGKDMHDGASPHFPLSVRNHLNQKYLNNWIGRSYDAPVN